jgi:hypothetical protein
MHEQDVRRRHSVFLQMFDYRTIVRSVNRLPAALIGRQVRSSKYRAIIDHVMPPTACGEIARPVAAGLTLT